MPKFGARRSMRTSGAECEEGTLWRAADQILDGRGEARPISCDQSQPGVSFPGRRLATSRKWTPISNCGQMVYQFNSARMDDGAKLAPATDEPKMNTVFFDSEESDECRRRLLYEGQLFVYSPTPGSLALIALAREL